MQLIYNTWSIIFISFLNCVFNLVDTVWQLSILNEAMSQEVDVGQLFRIYPCVTSFNITVFYIALIEDIYAKRLAKLAGSVYGDQEEGWILLCLSRQYNPAFRSWQSKQLKPCGWVNISWLFLELLAKHGNTSKQNFKMRRMLIRHFLLRYTASDVQITTFY